jgi:hypothetical protein
MIPFHDFLNWFTKALCLGSPAGVIMHPYWLKHLLAAENLVPGLGWLQCRQAQMSQRIFQSISYPLSEQT